MSTGNARTLGALLGEKVDTYDWQEAILVEYALILFIHIDLQTIWEYFQWEDHFFDLEHSNIVIDELF